MKSFGFDFHPVSWICTTLCLGGIIMSFFNSFGIISFQVSFRILLNKIVVIISQYFPTQLMFVEFVKKTSEYCIHNTLYILTLRDYIIISVRLWNFKDGGSQKARFLQCGDQVSRISFDFLKWRSTGPQKLTKMGF